MKKKNVSLLFFVLLIIYCTGCNNTSGETNAENKTVVNNEKTQIEECTKEIEEAASIIEIDDELQCKLIEDEKDKYKDIILEYSQVSKDIWYIVDDLNQNGRLELILAINNGTALYTDFAIFEVNEMFDGLQKYQFANDNTYMKNVVTGEVISDSLPDIIVDEVAWTANLSMGKVEYYWTDLLKINSNEQYIGHYKVWLEDGLVYQTLIAYKYMQGDGEKIETRYYDESGNEISVEQFNKLILPEVERDEKELIWRKYQDAVDINGLEIKSAEVIDTENYIIKCMVNDKEYILQLGGYEDSFIPYTLQNEIVDVTGDGKNDLIVNIKLNGNNLCENLSDTYVYKAGTVGLEEILYIAYDGISIWDEKYQYNIGCHASGDGSLVVNVHNASIEKESAIILDYIDGVWKKQ